MGEKKKVTTMSGTDNLFQRVKICNSAAHNSIPNQQTAPLPLLLTFLRFVSPSLQLFFFPMSCSINEANMFLLLD